MTRSTNRPINKDEIYLIDSGGQYPDGTTDVTRTMIVGTPTPEMKDRFTRVLKGHIALATVRFPEGTTGAQLDTLARRPLWDAGCDYDHGTGHGVGSYLSVHEGPQSISKRPITQKLLPGMICSNEPGFYKTGEYGIRIENLVVVGEPKDIGGDRKVMEFETITLAPIDLNLVEPSLLTAEESDWLNAYHARVREMLSPLVDAETRGLAGSGDEGDMKSDHAIPAGTVHRLTLDSKVLDGNFLREPVSAHHRRLCAAWDGWERACRCWSISSASRRAGRRTPTGRISARTCRSGWTG